MPVVTCERLGRNLKPPFRDRFTLIGLAAELFAALAGTKRGSGQCIPRARAPWCVHTPAVSRTARSSCGNRGP